MAIQIPNAGTGNGQTGDNEYVLWQKTINNFSDQTNAASRLVGTASGNVMEVGAFGLGTTIYHSDNTYTPNAKFKGFDNSTTGAPSASQGFQVGFAGNIAELAISALSRQMFFRQGFDQKASWSEVWHSQNATKDSNGFLKGASPIVDMYDSKIGLNLDATEQGGITFEKLGVGDYLVKGSLGFAQEGWYIEMPKDANGNVLVAVIYEQLENKDISVKTYAKMFDEETGDIVANTAKPRDIPATRWIDLRLQELPQDDTQPLSKDETVAADAEQ